MLKIFIMAYRDLGRNRRRSFFSALALAIGLALLLFMSAFIEGEIRTSLNATIQLQTGHLQVRAASYEEGKTSLKYEDLIAGPGAIASQIDTLDAVNVATPRLYASGVAINGDRTRGVSIVGIDPDSAANATYRAALTGGEFITANDRDGIYIGQKLGSKLGVSTGDQVNLLVNTANGDVAEQLFTIRGMYTTGIGTFDEMTVFLPLAKAQAITNTGDHASAIVILLKNRDQADAAAAALQTTYQVKTFEDLNPLLAMMEDFSGAIMMIFYLIVLGITVTVVVNTLVMAVFERTREIGILSAIGMKSGRIMAMFFAESILLAIGGILMGMVLSIAPIWWLTTSGFPIGDLGMTGLLFGDRIYGYLTLKNTITLTLTAIIVTLLAALYPALLAARMEPVEALHQGV